MSQRAYLRDGQKERFWRDVVRRQTTSGLSVREFCRLEKVGEASFYAWRRTLALRDQETTRKKPKRSATPKRSKKRPRRRTPSSTGNGRGHFVPLAVVGKGRSNPGPHLEIVTPGDWRVQVPSGFDAETLADVLGMLSTATVRTHGETA